MRLGVRIKAIPSKTINFKKSIEEWHMKDEWVLSQRRLLTQYRANEEVIKHRHTIKLCADE
jgi:hypothetical protein